MPLYRYDEKTGESREMRVTMYSDKFEYFVSADEASQAIPTRATGRRINQAELATLLNEKKKVWAYARVTKAERITNVNLDGAHKQTLRTYVFSPKLLQITEDSVESRWNLLETALRLAKSQNAQVFLGPEYFFSKQSSRLDGVNGQHTYSEAEKVDVEQRLKTFVNANKGMLVIPGTILWKDSLGQVRNTALICGADGQEFSSHDKKFAHNDEAFARAVNGSWKPGDAAAKDFEFQGVRCRYHICADDGKDPDEENVKELHLVSGFDYGAFNPRAHAGGFEVKSDGGSSGAKIQKGGIELSSAKGALDVPLTLPDTSQGSSASLEIQKPTAT